MEVISGVGALGRRALQGGNPHHSPQQADPQTHGRLQLENLEGASLALLHDAGCERRSAVHLLRNQRLLDGQTLKVRKLSTPVGTTDVQTHIAFIYV